jgi:hypothetical protein
MDDEFGDCEYGYGDECDLEPWSSCGACGCNLYRDDAFFTPGVGNLCNGCAFQVLTFGDCEITDC